MSDDKSKQPVNILQRIMTVIRDESRVLSEAVMDSCGTKRFEDDILVAQKKLQAAKSEITDVMAKELQTARKIDIAKGQIIDMEAEVMAALDANDEELAFVKAQAVVELEKDMLVQKEVQKSYALNLEHLKTMMEQTERELKEFERQLSMVRTTENIQKVTAAVSKNFDSIDSQLLSARRSLDRIRAQQKQVDQKTSDQGPEALGLQSRTQEGRSAGHQEQLTQDAQAVLKRIKHRDDDLS